MNTAMPRISQIWRALVAWLGQHELWLILLAVPPLLLPEFLPFVPVAAALVALAVVARLASRRPLRFGGLLDVAVVLLLIMLPVSLAVSSDPARSFPKFTTSLIGIALFWSLATGLHRAALRPAGLLLALSGIGLAALGLVGTDWPRSKILSIAAVYDLMPRITLNLPRATRGRFDPNEVAGAIVLLLPVALAALLGLWAERRSAHSGGRADRLSAFCFVGLLVSVLSLAGVFVLTQSRGAIAALAAGFAVAAFLRWPRAVLLAALASVVTAVGDAVLGIGALTTLVQTVTRSVAGDPASASGRVEMWGNAVRAIADYPLTGSGLHTFPAVSWANYVYAVVSPTWNMTHAHNAYLQAGVDFGVAGLLGFLLLVAVIFWRGIRYVQRTLPPFEAWLACGILGGLAGHLVHSLVDVAGRPLGDKPGIIFWAMAGLLLAGERLSAPLVARASFRLPSGAIVGAGILSLATLWVLTLGPAAPITRLNLGALALDQARLTTGLSADQRRELLSRAERLLTASLPWRADVVNLRLGMVYNEQGKPSEARAAWARTNLALDYLLSQANARLTMGETAQASSYVAHALAVAPTSSPALYLAGAAAFSEGRFADAITLFEKALAYDTYTPHSDQKARTLASLGNALMVQKRWPEAVAAYEQAEAIAARFTWQRELAYAMLQRDGNSAAAESYLLRAIAQSPGQVEPYVGMMDVMLASGRTAEAIALGEQTIRRFPEALSPLIVLGRIYIDQGAFDRARDMFQRAVTLRPRLVESRLWLVRIALAQQQPAEALAVLDEAMALSPDQPEYYASLGDVKVALADWTGAALAYGRALELDPANVAARNGLSKLPR
jgi:putative inorganic carbon (HCO3(-)) transporter